MSIHINVHTAYRTYIYTPTNTYICIQVYTSIYILHIVTYTYTYYVRKRDLLHTQKRPTDTGIPEVCISVKRDLRLWQKRPITHTKETYRHWHTWAPSVCHSVNPPGGYQYSPAHTKKKFKKKFFHFSLPVQPCTHQEMKEKKLCLQSGKP